MKTIKYLLLVLVMAYSGYSVAQSPLPVGRTQLNLGVGLSSWGVPVYIGLDHSVHPDITLGAEVSYRSYRENWKNNYYNHSIMGFSGNANYHFNSALNIPQKWDLYAGVNVGFFSWNSPNSYTGQYRSGLGVGGQVGGRYYLSNKEGLNLEFGGGNAFAGGKFGLSFKL